jgi:hypothetical protein
MRFALLLAALAFLASCGNQSRLIDGHLQAYRYVVVERAEVAQASDRGDFAAELAAELARSGFEVVDAARLDRDAAVADEAVQAYARVDDGTLWTSVAVTLKDYRTGAPVWEHGDKSNTRAKAIAQCLERLRRQYGGFSQREADLKRQRAGVAPAVSQR